MNERKHGVRASLERVGILFGFKEWVFALFLLAGIFKPNPESSNSAFDLTVVTAVITFGCAAWVFLRSRRRPVKASLTVLCFFLLFVPTLFWTDWTPYAVEKASRFFTLTLMAMVTPLYLIRTHEELRRFLSGFLFLCTVVTATALVVMLGQGAELERLMVLDATTIATGRSIGAVATFAALLWFEKSTNRFLLNIVLVILPTLLVAAGAKGPLVSVPLALVATLLLFRTRVRAHLHRLLLVSLLSAGAFWLSLPIIPWTSLFRVGSFFGGQLGGSELDRASFYVDSLHGIEKNPEGLGLGGFASKFGVGAGEIREFSHNILLEVFLEGGWVTGLYFVSLFVSGLAGIYLAAKKRGPPFIYRLLFCLIMFFFLNDLVSGELNDSKVLLAFIGIAAGIRWALPYSYRAKHRIMATSLSPVVQ
jgi:hypothetical protein